MSVEELAHRLARAERIVAFTGAGMSTGSGIPDFRGPNGLWKRFQPVYFQDFIASEEARVRHWDFKLAGWEGFRDARPNEAHRALVELERQGSLLAVVTQNIDGLHQKAGHAAEMVIELHGTNLRVECVDCGSDLEPDPVYREFAETRRCPTCASCGGFLKPATVSFGQAMPAEPLQRAFELAEACDLMVSLGSTLEVEPAASVPKTAVQMGADYVILNRGPTAHDHLADLRIEGDIVEVLPGAIASG